MNILAFVIFEISLRVCAQSLFATNASYYLSLSTKILTKFLSQFVNIKTKKSDSSEIQTAEQHIEQKKFNSFTEYAQVVRKQSIKNASLLLGLYQMLFKSISIQMSNFVNANSKIEMDTILNQIYVFLCNAQNSNREFYTHQVLTKFIHSNCFNRNSQTLTPSSTPTKLASSTTSIGAGSASMGQTSATYLQFAFKYLIYFDATSEMNKDPLMHTQLRTMCILNENLSELLLNEKKFESSTVNALVLILIWCLASKNKKIRCQALSLLEKINGEFANNVR